MSIDALWSGICIIAVLVTVFIATLILVTWKKLDLIFDIVKRKQSRKDGDGG